MKPKKRSRILSILICIMLCMIFLANLPHPAKSISDENLLVDKVFTFHAPGEQLIRAVPLVQNETYCIYMEVVSPHTCSINLKMNDTDGDMYELFDSQFNGDSDIGSYKEFPYLAARNGTHHFFFTVTCSVNLNIYISINRDLSMINQDADNFRVRKIFDGYSEEFNFTLNTDYMYNFYFLRGSSFPEGPFLEICINLWARAPDGGETLFTLMNEKELIDLGVRISTFFGTAINGTYNFGYNVSTTLQPFNLAMELVSDHQITEVIPGNSTNPSNNETDTGPNAQDDDGGAGGGGSGGGGSGKKNDEDLNTTTAGDPYANMSLPAEILAPVGISLGVILAGTASWLLIKIRKNFV